jgi:uncharacterized protein YecE (DUF72 family)
MIRLGTCSWTEKSLIESGEFYPKEIKTAEGRLRYYAGLFDTVEVDSTYYAIPHQRTTFLWVDRTPDEFIFHVKAYGALTGHGVNPKALPKDIFNLLPEKDKNERHIYIHEQYLIDTIAERFRDALSPLIKAGKLGMLVFQFPPWFHYKTSNFDYILRCKALMKILPIAVEFRHGSWLTPESAEPVLHFLRKNQLSYITADEPQYSSLATIPFLPHVTTDVAYFRFHGRNTRNWLKKGIETSLRYSYLYSDSEISDFIQPLQDSQKKTKVTYAMFNNCHGGFAMKNALRLKQLLKIKNKLHQE